MWNHTTTDCVITAIVIAVAHVASSGHACRSSATRCCSKCVRRAEGDPSFASTGSPSGLADIALSSHPLRTARPQPVLRPRQYRSPTDFATVRGRSIVHSRRRRSARISHGRSPPVPVWRAWRWGHSNAAGDILADRGRSRCAAVRARASGRGRTHRVGGTDGRTRRRDGRCPSLRPRAARRRTAGHRRIRGAAIDPSRASAVPVIMLTGAADEADRVLGLEIGADDYVVKPFMPRELVGTRRRAPAPGAPDRHRAPDDVRHAHGRPPGRGPSTSTVGRSR